MTINTITANAETIKAGDEFIHGRDVVTAISDARMGFSGKIQVNFSILWQGTRSTEFKPGDTVRLVKSGE